VSLTGPLLSIEDSSEICDSPFKKRNKDNKDSNYNNGNNNYNNDISNNTLLIK
jgi:hypothetical protein